LFHGDETKDYTTRSQLIERIEAEVNITTTDDKHKVQALASILSS
jgi:hypothetical protein